MRLRIGWQQRLELSRRGDEECWPWAHSRLTNGYGYINVGGTKRPAHRIVYEHLTGRPIPEGFHLDHLCRNRACVNPAHLEAVTPRTNCLRSESLPAKNARKTHCKRGHEITHPWQYYISRHPNCTSRRCRICCSENYAAYKPRRIRAK